MATILSNSVIGIVIIDMCTHPQAILLAMITMENGFPLLSYMGIHLAALWTTRAP